MNSILQGMVISFMRSVMNTTDPFRMPTSTRSLPSKSLLIFAPSSLHLSASSSLLISTSFTSFSIILILLEDSDFKNLLCIVFHFIIITDDHGSDIEHIISVLEDEQSVPVFSADLLVDEDVLQL